MEHILGICFLGGGRYQRPLDTTTKKKFCALQGIGEFYVIGFSKKLCPDRFTEYARFYLLPKLPIAVLRYLEIFTIGSSLALWLVFRHRVRVLVAQSPYEGFAAALTKNVAACLGRRVVLIVESHGDFEESLFLYRRILFPRLYRLFMRYAAEYAFRHADILRAISNTIRKQLEQWAPNKRVVQFPAWTDMEVFLQSGGEEIGRPTQEILYAGALIPLKGIHHLINAFAPVASTFPEARLIIIGREQNRAYASALKAQVEQLRLNGRVEFIGEIPQVELARWMQRACVLVLPSLFEGLGRVLIEAMASGTPVIGSRIGGIPELIEDGVTGHLVPPGDEVALAEGLRWVLEHLKDTQEMGSRAHAFAKQFFSTEAYVRCYAELFEKAVGKKLCGDI